MTTTTPENFFDDTEADAGRGGVKRDGRGRAELYPRGIVGKVRVPYSSASGLADYISDSEFVEKWKRRYLAIAMGRNPDLAALAAGEPYNTGLYPPAQRDKTQSGYRVDNIIERALDRQGIAEKADYGTAIHAFTEPGADQSAVPEHMKADVASFWRKLNEESVEIVDTEQFTANDATMTAGTYDHGVRVLGHPLLTGYVAADKKTGRVDPFHWEIQIATYARGEAYDITTHERRDIAPDVNLDYGLVIHIAALQGRTDFYIVDLQRGWRNAQLAAQVRDTQDEGAKQIAYTSAKPHERIAALQTRAQANQLWTVYTDEVTRQLIREKVSTLP